MNTHKKAFKKNLQNKKIHLKKDHKLLVEAGVLLTLGAGAFAVQQLTKTVTADENNTVRADTDNVRGQLGYGDDVNENLLSERVSQNIAQTKVGASIKKVSTLPTQFQLSAIDQYAGHKLEVSSVKTTNSIKDIRSIKNADVYYTSSIRSSSEPTIISMTDVASLHNLPDLQISSLDGLENSVRTSSHLYTNLDDALRDASFYKDGQAIKSSRAKTVSLISKTNLNAKSPLTFTGDNNARVSLAFDRNFKVAVDSPTMNENVKSDLIDNLEKNFTVSYQGREYHAVYHDEKISTDSGASSEDGYFTFSQEQHGLPLQVNGLYIAVGATFVKDGESTENPIQLKMGAVTTIEDSSKWDTNSTQSISVTGDSSAKVTDNQEFYETYAQKQVIHSMTYNYITVKTADSTEKSTEKSTDDSIFDKVEGVLASAASVIEKGIGAIFGGEKVSADTYSASDLPTSIDQVKAQDTTGRYANKTITNISDVKTSDTLPSSGNNQDIYYKTNTSTTTSAPKTMTTSEYQSALNFGATVSQVGSPIQVGTNYKDQAAANAAASELQGGFVQQVKTSQDDVQLTTSPTQGGYLGLQDHRTGTYSQGFEFTFSTMTSSQAVKDQFTQLIRDNFKLTMNDGTVYRLTPYTTQGSVVYFQLQDANGNQLVDAQGGGNGTYAMFKIDFGQFDQNIYSTPQMSIAFVRSMDNLNDVGMQATISAYTQGVGQGETEYQVMAPQYSTTTTQTSYDYVTVDWEDVQTPDTTNPSVPSGIGGGNTQTPDITNPSVPGGIGGGNIQTPDITNPSVPGGIGGGNTQTPDTTNPSVPGGIGGGNTQTPDITNPSVPGGFEGGDNIQTPDITNPSVPGGFGGDNIQTPDITNPSVPGGIGGGNTQTPDITNPRVSDGSTDSGDENTIDSSITETEISGNSMPNQSNADDELIAGNDVDSPVEKDADIVDKNRPTTHELPNDKNIIESEVSNAGADNVVTIVEKDEGDSDIVDKNRPTTPELPNDNNVIESEISNSGVDSTTSIVRNDKDDKNNEEDLPTTGE
ncbi:MAG: hypothetical protein LBT69_02900 [Lactobacillales bacterium]|jgi:hypothetical protein|nr:hypothetical protein [Lactobacillales bacterium]